jgi:sterol O-acyltransferase
MVAYLLLFYIIFGKPNTFQCISPTSEVECICNGFAELSMFADRQFYEDWVCLPIYLISQACS